MQLKVLIHHLKDLHCTQGWEFAHLAQIKWATVSDLLRSLTTYERLWVNSSGHSRQMSNRERIAHDKWANEWFAQKCWLNNLKSCFLVCFYRFFYFKKLAMGSSPHFWWAMWANCSGHSPKMSEWANRSFYWANRSIAHFRKKRPIRSETVERIPSPDCT